MGNTQTKQSISYGGNGDKFLKSIELTDANFEIRQDGRVLLKRTNGFDNVENALIAFYAPWCHYCTELAPQWNEYAKKMNTKSFNFLAVNCTANDCQKVTNALNIQGFPTIYYVQSNGELVRATYEDGGNVTRTREGIRDFLKEKGLLKK